MLSAALDLFTFGIYTTDRAAGQPCACRPVSRQPGAAALRSWGPYAAFPGAAGWQSQCLVPQDSRLPPWWLAFQAPS